MLSLRICPLSPVHPPRLPCQPPALPGVATACLWTRWAGGVFASPPPTTLTRSTDGGVHRLHPKTQAGTRQATYTALWAGTGGQGGLQEKPGSSEPPGTEQHWASCSGGGRWDSPAKARRWQALVWVRDAGAGRPRQEGLGCEVEAMGRARGPQVKFSGSGQGPRPGLLIQDKPHGSRTCPRDFHRPG